MRTPQSNCPSCGKPLDAATFIMGDENVKTPEDDDLTVCIYCRSFLKFYDGLKLRLMTQQEIAELPDKIRNMLIRTRQIISEVIKEES